MKHILLTFLLSLLLSPVLLASNLTVQGLQAPAWMERNGTKEPLTVNSVLQSNDIVHTGATGKLWLEMADGAIVKLGKDARMKVKSIRVNEDATTSEKTVQAGLEVLVGAFRYTTSKLEEHLGWKRSVDIQLATTAAIGIRGTDLWGQVSGDNQFVVLLEGNINVTPSASGAVPVILDKPLQIFKVENEQALPISTVDMSAVQALAPETELDFGRGVQQADGQYRVNLASTQSDRAAQRLLKALAKRGYAATSETIEVYGETWTRIVLDHAVSRDDARSLADALADDLDVISPWIQKL